MKKAALFISVILILALSSAIGCSSSNDKSSPEETVEELLKATLTSGDMEQVLSYCTQRMIDDLYGLHSLEEVVESWASMDAKLANIETTLVSQAKDEAVVKIRYDILVEYEGESVDQSTDSSFALVKDSGRWLVDEDLNSQEDEDEKTPRKPPKTEYIIVRLAKSQ